MEFNAYIGRKLGRRPSVFSNSPRKQTSSLLASRNRHRIV